MLKRMGFIPTIYNWTITLNGPIMLEKWIKEIGSSNPKNIAKLEKAKKLYWADSLKDRIRPCGGCDRGSIPRQPVKIISMD